MLFHRPHRSQTKMSTSDMDGSVIEESNLQLQLQGEVTTDMTDEDSSLAPADNDQNDDAECMECGDESANGDHENEEESDQEVENAKKLFVGGLNTITTDEDLKEHFSKFGTVEKCTVAIDKAIVAKKKKRTGSKGFGFVTMSTAEEAQAILKEKHTVQGRLVAVTISKPLSEPEKKLKLAVSYLDKEKTTEESLREYFSKFGTVTSCTLSMEEKEDKMVSRGFAFVVMALEEEVDTILSENKHGRQMIDGANVEVKPVRVTHNRTKRRQVYVGNLDLRKTKKADLRAHFAQFGEIQEISLPKKGQNFAKTNKGYAFVKMCRTEDFEAVVKAHKGKHGVRIHDRVLDVKRAGNQENNEKLRKFYVGELDKEKTTESDLRDYFSAFGTVVECTIVREKADVEGEEGPSKGYAFLIMSTIEETDAILKHPEPHVVHEKEVVVNRASPHTLHRAMITEVTKVNVTNFRNTDISEEDLRTYFSAYGNIVSIELPCLRTTGHKMGFAVVELDNHHDVEKLTIMHEHYIKDHRCVVTKFKRKDDSENAKLKRRQEERRKRAMSQQGRGFARGGGRGGDWRGGPPNKGRGQRGRGRGRGGWEGGSSWERDSSYSDGYYQGWQSDFGPVRGYQDRRGEFSHSECWYQDSFEGWDEGNFSNAYDNGWGIGRGALGQGTAGRGTAGSWGQGSQGQGSRGTWQGNRGHKGRPY